MQIKPVTDSSFKKYGRIIDGYDFTQLLDTLEKTTEKPADRVVYIPSDATLEALPVFAELRDNEYGGMPIQIGYCNGANSKLNCLEYHRDSELNIAADDVVLLVALLSDVEDGFVLDTAKVEAFLLPKGCAVQAYETTLHYAPAKSEGSFRVIVVLPKNTNTDKPEITIKNAEDKLLWARNKWLLAHKDTDEARQGAHIGLIGENLDIAK